MKAFGPARPVRTYSEYLCYFHKGLALAPGGSQNVPVACGAQEETKTQEPNCVLCAADRFHGDLIKAARELSVLSVRGAWRYPPPSLGYERLGRQPALQLSFNEDFKPWDPSKQRTSGQELHLAV